MCHTGDPGHTLLIDVEGNLPLTCPNEGKVVNCAIWGNGYVYSVIKRALVITQNVECRNFYFFPLFFFFFFIFH